MNRSLRAMYALVLMAASMPVLLAVAQTVGSSDSDTQATLQKIVEKNVADINKGDVNAIVDECAPHTAVVDGFPPYAWDTCADWWKAYASNNKAIGATLGTLGIGNPIYTEVMANDAYLIYPATFTDTQNGKQVVYQGIGTLVLRRIGQAWAFTGSAWAWGVNSHLAKK